MGEGQGKTLFERKRVETENTDDFPILSQLILPYMCVASKPSLSVMTGAAFLTMQVLESYLNFTAEFIYSPDR